MSKKPLIFGGLLVTAALLFAQTGPIPNWTPFGLSWVNSPNAPAARAKLGIIDNPQNVVWATGIDGSHITTNGGVLKLKTGGLPPWLNGLQITNTTITVYDVRRFGAIPNDGVNDVPAIQDAIDAACNKDVQRGGVVFIPEGVWDIKPTITRHFTRTSEGKKSILNITNNSISIVGEGADRTILRILSYANENNFEDYNGIACGSTPSLPIPDIDPATGQQWIPWGCTNLVFKGFTWDGRGRNFPFHSSICYDTTQLFGEDITFEDVKFMDIWTDAIDSLGTGGYLRVRNCVFTNVAGDHVGVHMKATYVENCEFYGGPNNDTMETWYNNNGGLPAITRQEYLEMYGEYWLVKNCTFWGMKDKQIVSSAYGVERAFFEGNLFISSNTVPAASPNLYNPTNFVIHAGNWVFSDNLFFSPNTPNTTAPWFHLYNASASVTFNNNRIWGRRIANVYDVGPLRLFADGNYFGNGAIQINNSLVMFYFQGGGGHTIKNNSFWNASLYYANKSGQDTWGENIINNQFWSQSEIYQEDTIDSGTNWVIAGNQFRTPPDAAVAPRCAIWPTTRMFHKIYNNVFRADIVGLPAKLQFTAMALDIRGNSIDLMSFNNSSTECTVMNNTIDALDNNVGYRTVNFSGNTVGHNTTSLGNPVPGMPWTASDIVIYTDQKADGPGPGLNGGDAITASGWRTITLNTTVSEGNSTPFTLNANVITVNASGAGKWRVRGNVPFYSTANSASRLRRTNNTPTTLLVGARVYSYNLAYTTDQSILDGIVTLAAGDTLEVQGYVSVNGNVGYTGITMSEVDVFTQVAFERL
jgi:hypothetical protein